VSQYSLATADPVEGLVSFNA